MFDFIRSHQRLMQFFLLVLIVPSFALIGVSGYNSYVSGDHDLVKVGKSAITMQEFENARASQLRQMQQNSQGGFDPAVLDDPEVRRNLLESLIDYRVLATTAASERFNVSDTALRDSIAAMPQLQVEGQFSPERYNEALAAAGMTTRDFEESQRFELALSRVLGPVTQTASVPSAVVQHLERALTEERTLRLRVFADSDYTDSVSISDSEIQVWYDEHKQSFEVPEQASIQYLLLDEDAAMASVPELSDDDLKTYYEQNKDRFTQAARVNLSHIQVNVAAGATQEQRDKALQEAQELLTKVQADPSTFAQVAREFSQDAGTAKSGGELGWITQGSWPAGLDRAVFALEKGQISDIIDGPGGYHIFLANDVQREETRDFTEVRTTVAQEVKHQLGAERFADMATRLTSLVYDHPESLDPVAQALGVPVKSATGVGRDRLLTADEVGGETASASQDADVLGDVRVRRAVFSPQVVAEGHNSGVIEISPDTMLAVRVNELLPAHIPALEKIADQIRETLAESKAHQAAVSAGQAYLSELKGQNGSLSDVPEGFGDAQTVSRVNPQGVEKPVLDASLALRGDSLPAYTGVEGARGFVAVRVERADHGQADSGLMASLPTDLARMWSGAEEQAVLKDMRFHAGVEVLPEAQEAVSGAAGDSN